MSARAIAHAWRLQYDELHEAALKVVRLHDEVVGCLRPGGVDADEYDNAFEDLRDLLTKASGMEARQGQDAQRLDGEAATARLDARK